MEMSETEPTAIKRQVWNAGRTVGAKRALKPKQILRQVGLFSSKYSLMLGPACWLGSIAGEAWWTITYFPAGLIIMGCSLLLEPTA